MTNELIVAIQNVWQQIAFDIPVDTCPAAEVVELCIDADRLATHGYHDEQREAREMIHELGYEKFLTMVANALPFDEYEAGGASSGY